MYECTYIYVYIYKYVYAYFYIIIQVYKYMGEYIYTWIYNNYMVLTDWAHYLHIMSILTTWHSHTTYTLLLTHHLHITHLLHYLRITIKHSTYDSRKGHTHTYTHIRRCRKKEKKRVKMPPKKKQRLGKDERKNQKAYWEKERTKSIMKYKESRTVLQKRPTFLRSLLVVAAP